MPKLRILAIDDDPIVLDALATQLKQTDDMELVGTAPSAPEGIALLHDIPAEVVVMDVRMPRMSGTTATGMIKELYPEMRVILLTNYDDQGLLDDAMTAGADGLLLKGDGIKALISALRASNDGTMVVSQRPMRRAHVAPQAPANIKLTQREREVLSLLCRAHSNAQIAEALFLSESRVKFYISQLMERFDVESRLALAVKAFELHLADPV